MLLQVKRLSKDAVVPQRGSKHAAGYDICSSEDCIVPARSRYCVKTDLAVAIPSGHYGRIGKKLMNVCISHLWVFSLQST